MVFKNCQFLKIQITTNAELTPTIFIFAIFYKIWCYQMSYPGWNVGTLINVQTSHL